MTENSSLCCHVKLSSSLSLSKEVGVSVDRADCGSLAAMVWKVTISSDTGGMLALTLKMTGLNTSVNVDIVECRC